MWVEHALGSLQNPMTDALLEGTFHGLGDTVLAQAQTTQLLAHCWARGETASVHTRTALARRQHPQHP